MKNLNEEVSKPRKVALYSCMDIDDYYTVLPYLVVDYDEHYTPFPDGQTREKPYERYVRVSEPIELRFSPLANDSIIQKAVESLDEMERKAIADLNEKIAKIRGQKAQLLALAYQRAEEA